MAAEKKSRAQEYNAKGSHEMGEAEDTTSNGFRKGGKTRRERRMGGKPKGGLAAAHEMAAEEHKPEREHHKDGGRVEGHKARARADKPARRAAGGKTPYSAGHALRGPEHKGGSGHESERPSEGD